MIFTNKTRNPKVCSANLRDVGAVVDALKVCFQWEAILKTNDIPVPDRPLVKTNFFVSQGASDSSANWMTLKFFKDDPGYTNWQAALTFQFGKDLKDFVLTRDGTTRLISLLSNALEHYAKEQERRDNLAAEQKRLREEAEAKRLSNSIIADKLLPYPPK